MQSNRLIAATALFLAPSSAWRWMGTWLCYWAEKEQYDKKQILLSVNLCSHSKFPSVLYQISSHFPVLLKKEEEEELQQAS